MEPGKKTGKIPCLPVVAVMVILIPVLVVAGCTGNSPPEENLPVNGTEWALMEYMQDGVSRPAVSGTAVTLVFGDDGQITGSAGCNHYFAGYELNGSAITIGEAGSTMMYCAAPGVMEQETAYLALLGRAAILATGNDRLTLRDANGTPVLSFTKIVPPAPQPLVGTNWTLDSLYAGDIVSSVITGTTVTAVFGGDGHLAGSSGCNHYSGPYTARGSHLAIGPVGATKMHCAGRGIMLQEDSYLAALGKTATFTIRGNQLVLLDTDGARLLSFTMDD